MSDLVERLRRLHEQGYPPLSALEEAAARIEALEAALERAANALQKAGEMYAEQDARAALTSSPADQPPAAS